MLRSCAVLLILTSSALANDGDMIVQEAQKCWAIVDVEKTLQFSAEVDARIEPDGRSFFRVTSYSPNNTDGDSLSKSVLRALNRCGPYSVAPGLYQFTFRLADPFKD